MALLAAVVCIIDVHACACWPVAAAYATAAALVDVPSGRAAGVFVVDNTATGSTIPPGHSQLPPSCVAFDAGAGKGAGAVQPLVALFIIGHHYNDRTVATATFTTGDASQLSVLNGLGAPMPANVTTATAAASGGAAGTPVTLTITIAPLPQYVLLPVDVDPQAVCASLAW